MGQARKKALTPAQYRSHLGHRPYDLRHAVVSLWLNSEVPAPKAEQDPGDEGDDNSERTA